jgi:hypothetical protein
MHRVVLATTVIATAIAAAAGTARAASPPAVADSTRSAADTTAARGRDATLEPTGAATVTAESTAVGPNAVLAAQIDAIAAAATPLPALERRVLDELLAAARELAADGDVEAATLVLDDARSLVQRSAR